MKQTYTKFCFKFNNDKDSVIVQTLQGIRNKTNYIRDLITLDLARQERCEKQLSDKEYRSILRYLKELGAANDEENV